MWAPDLRRAFGEPIGVQSGRSAARVSYFEGTVVNHLDLRDTPLPERMRLIRNGACWQPVAGMPCTFYYYRNGRSTAYVVKTEPELSENGIVVILRCALALLWLIAAAALVLLRPSHATWAFFCLSLYGFTPNNIVTEVGPPWWQVAMTSFDVAWENAIPYIAPIFALYLLQPEVLPRWRRTALFGAYGLAIAVAVYESIGTVAVAAGNMTVFNGLQAASFLSQWIVDVVPVILAPLLLLATYLGSTLEIRQRVRWVLVGFTVGAIAIYLSNWALKLSYFAYSLCFAAYVLSITASTAYAVLRHRIIDVNVVLGRTLVYTLLSGVVVGVFALVDLFFSRVLSANNGGLIADVAVALVIGFFLNSMHGQIDRFVDGVVFRRRHIADKHIVLVAQSLRHATHSAGVSAMLVEEPVRAFDLQFAALARRIPNYALEVVHATQPDLLRARLESADAICAYVNAQRRALTVRDHFWRPQAFVSARLDAAIAVPVFSHDDLDGIVFFGPHRNGTELDGDEVALIERLAEAAGAAYDRLRVKELEREIAVLKLQPASLG